MTQSDRPLPRLALLRDLTDRAVLDHVFTFGRVTRAELAGQTGISKPTISESVRRLESAGLLRATGSDQTGRRGRVATFYELAKDAGRVLGVEVNQRGVHVVVADLADQPIDERRQAGTGALAEALHDTVRDALDATAEWGPVRALALSTANPVAPDSREIIPMPDSPFPEGWLRPAEVLADLVSVPILVDNDVNLSALAERRAGAATEARAFAYLYVGGGLGMSLYLGDRLVRGAHGLAGEIGYLELDGVPLDRVIAGRGFGRPDAPALDVDALLAVCDRAGSGDRAAAGTIGWLGEVLGRAVAATCVVFDPDLVLLGGPVGVRPELLGPVREAVARLTVTRVRVALGGVTESAALRGALLSALDTARDELLQ